MTPIDFGVNRSKSGGGICVVQHFLFFILFLYIYIFTWLKILHMCIIVEFFLYIEVKLIGADVLTCCFYKMYFHCIPTQVSV